MTKYFTSFHIKDIKLKVIGFNGSPRKGWNTGLIVKKALEGARDAGAQTKLYQLQDLKIKSCSSCLACKRKIGYNGICAIRDDLTDILKEIKTADAIVFGTPIYFCNISALAHKALERIWFSNSTYSKEYSIFPKTAKSLMIYTMNVTEKDAKTINLDHTFDIIKLFNEWVFKDKSERLCVYDTQQVKDYSKYDITVFDIPEKLKRRKEIFPKDLEKAYELGRALVTKK